MSDPSLPFTEQVASKHAELDQYPIAELVRTLVEDQARAAEAVLQASSQLALAVAEAVPRLEAGGRLLYVGAGTSGRLGLLDSVELNPTFSWPRERAVALLAGGSGALHAAVEGAEDDLERGASDLAALSPTPQDVVILLAASGATPFTLGALRAARSAGALTVGIANNAGSPLALGAEVGLVLDTGPELVSGSTRMKAGTAQKIALNAFSTAVMVRMNKVFGNLMVDLRPTNAKLRRRALRILLLATGADPSRAQEALEACAFEVKPAILGLLRGLTPEEARACLAACGGSVRRALHG